MAKIKRKTKIIRVRAKPPFLHLKPVLSIYRDRRKPFIICNSVNYYINLSIENGNRGNVIKEQSWQKGQSPLLTKDGNVGINTTVPAQTLTVQGTLNVTAQNTRSGDLFVASNGFIGINQTNPSSKFEVAGTANITSSSTQFLVNSNGDVTINLKG